MPQKGYKKEILDFMRLKFETVQSNTVIARDVVKTFEIIDRDVETVRKYISKYRQKVGTKSAKKEFKRLFFDIETTYVYAKVWRPGKQYVNPSNIKQRTRIICVSYKWQEEDKVHTITWDKNQDDRKLVKDIIKILGQADEIIAHNGDRFDIKQLRTRAILQGELMYAKYRTLDTLKKARQFFSFHSNKLDYLGEVLQVGRKLDHEGLGLWDKVQEGDKSEQKEALAKMVEYCEQDVILLQDVFMVMMPYIDHNTNYAVLKGGAKWQCPECGGKDVKLSHTDTTPLGYIKRHMKCRCKKSYHISNRSYTDFIVYQYQNNG